MTNSTANSALSSLQKSDSSLYQYPSTSTKKDSEVGKDDFIKMLVTQLKNQDPMDPLSNDRFAVDLATFSQLEQLIDINDKLGSEKTTDATSMAGFLGTEVKINSQTVNVKNNDGGSVAFDLGQDASSVEVQLVDASGAVVDTVDAGQLAAGNQTVSLKNLAVKSGDYTVKVLAHGTTGTLTEPQAFVAGTVVGYVPGTDPKLIVGNQEYGLSDVLEVRSAKDV